MPIVCTVAQLRAWRPTQWRFSTKSPPGGASSCGLAFLRWGLLWSVRQTTLRSNVSFTYIHHRCLSWSGLHFTLLFFACRTAPWHRMRTRREAAAQVPRPALKLAFLSGNHWVGHWLAGLCLIWLAACVALLVRLAGSTRQRLVPSPRAPREGSGREPKISLVTILNVLGDFATIETTKT